MSPAAKSIVEEVEALAAHVEHLAEDIRRLTERLLAEKEEPGHQLEAAE